MKNLILLISINFLQFSFVFSQTKEVIKIEIDKDCDNHIGKRQYENELYTTMFTVVSDILHKSYFQYAYVENRDLVYFTLNDKMFFDYNLGTLFISVDSVEFKLKDKLDFKKIKTVTATLEETFLYSIGFELNKDLISAINNSKTISLSLINETTKKRKTWKFSDSDALKVKESYLCYKRYSDKLKEKYLLSLKDTEFDFRNSNWKDSKTKVKQIEKNEIVIDEKDVISYNVKLNNDDFTAYFQFNNDLLYRGSYVFKGEFVNGNNYYNKYKQIVSILESKYGTPKNVNKYRTSDLFTDIDDIGLAIETGRYSESTVWETKDSFIRLFITGENFEFSLLITYLTKDEVILEKVDSINLKTKQEGF